MDHKFNYSRRHFEMWPEKFEKDKEDIHVLHFTGADNNPWSKEPENEMERIWWSNFDC
jgi:lipopolysaccharide biosynthesis glycosyltransferase